MSVLISFHGGHSGQFCDHAESTLEEVVKSYIENGFSHVGLSEHQPRPDKFLYPDEIALKRTSEFIFARFEQYAGEAKRLQEKYSSQIKLLFGFETEYCNGKAGLELIKDLREKYQPDYIVGSLHHVNDIAIDYDKETYQLAVKDCGSLQKLYAAYYDQQLELLQACKPEVVGHLDLIRIFSADEKLSEDVISRVKRNIEFIKSYGGLIELNARAYRKCLAEPYPCAVVLQQVANIGAEVTLGDDSHGAGQVGENIGRAIEVAKKYFQNVVALEKQNGGLKKVELKL